MLVLFLRGWLSLLRAHRHLVLQICQRRTNEATIHVVFVGLLVSKSWSIHKVGGIGTPSKGFFCRAGSMSSEIPSASGVFLQTHPFGFLQPADLNFGFWATVQRRAARSSDITISLLVNSSEETVA